MQRQPVWTKTQGAAGLFAAALGVLITLAAPASTEGFADGGGVSGAARATQGSFAPLPASSAQVQKAASFVPTIKPDRSFHSVDQTTSPQSLSGGALGMFLLGLLSIALIGAAFLLRTTEPQQDR